jgi:hypothetical protein
VNAAAAAAAELLDGAFANESLDERSADHGITTLDREIQHCSDCNDAYVCDM